MRVHGDKPGLERAHNLYQRPVTPNHIANLSIHTGPLVLSTGEQTNSRFFEFILHRSTAILPTGLMTTHCAARSVGRGPEADLVLRPNDQFTRREHGSTDDTEFSLSKLYRPFAMDHDIFTPEAVLDGEVVTARHLIKKLAVECPANIAV